MCQVIINYSYCNVFYDVNSPFGGSFEWHLRKIQKCLLPVNQRTEIKKVFKWKQTTNVMTWSNLFAPNLRLFYVFCLVQHLSHNFSFTVFFITIHMLEKICPVFMTLYQHMPIPAISFEAPAPAEQINNIPSLALTQPLPLPQ